MKAGITSYCLIRNNELFLNGEKLVEKGPELNFTAFIKSAYELNASPWLKFFKMDDLSKLAFVASEFLLKNVKLNEHYRSEDVSLLFSNRSSSLATDIEYYKTVESFPSPSLFVYTLPNIMVGEISIRHKIKGENAFFIFDHFQADFLCNYATQLIREEKAKAIIVGWVELLKDKHEAFLYLVEENKGEELNPETIEKLYRTK